MELEHLEHEGFGKYSAASGSGRSKKSVFFKVPGSFVDTELGNHENILKMAGVTVENYTKLFEDLSSTSDVLMTICRNEHPNVDEFMDMLY